MASAIEETIRKCRRCAKKTIHHRSINKTGLLMFLVHLVLTVVTAGLWLILVVIWLVLNARIGGWTCKECGK
jgi:hypothetical protein